MRTDVYPTPHIIDRQRDRVLEIKQRLRERTTSFADPLIVTNPFNLTPLTALICFDTPAEEQYIVTVPGHAGSGDVSYMGGPYTTHHRIPVIGLYPGVENKVLLRNRSGEEKSYTIRTNPLPEEVVPLKRSGQPPHNSLLFFLPADGVHLPCAFDAAGDCRWYCTEPLAHRLKLDGEGFLLTGAPPLLAPPYGGTALWQMDLLGRVRKEFRIPGGFCCDFLQGPDRKIISIGQGTTTGTVADHLHWVDHRSGEIVQSLDLSEVLTTEGGNPDQSGTDWFQARSLRYDSAAHSVTVSGTAQNVLVEVDAATARPMRLFGDPQKLGNKQGLVQEMKSNVSWPREPYGGLLTRDALHFLNGNRYLDKEEVREPLSLALYDLTKQRHDVLVQEEDFPISPLFNGLKEREDGAMEIHAGSCSRMPDGRMPKVPGIFNRIQYPNTELWSERILWRENSVFSKDVFHTNSLSSEEVQVPALRFVSLEETTALLGQWGLQPEVDVDLPIAQEEPLPEDMEVHIWSDEARLYIKTSFFQGEMCLLVLRQGLEEKKYFIQSSRRPYGADWLLSYPEGMERPVLWAVPIDLLKGAWEIGLLIDDTYYDTGYTLRTEGIV